MTRQLLAAVFISRRPQHGDRLHARLGREPRERAMPRPRSTEMVRQLKRLNVQMAALNTKTDALNTRTGDTQTSEGSVRAPADDHLRLHGSDQLQATLS